LEVIVPGEDSGAGESDGDGDSLGLIHLQHVAAFKVCYNSECFGPLFEHLADKAERLNLPEKFVQSDVSEEAAPPTASNATAAASVTAPSTASPASTTEPSAAVGEDLIKEALADAAAADVAEKKNLVDVGGEKSKNSAPGSATGSGVTSATAAPDASVSINAAETATVEPAVANATEKAKLVDAGGVKTADPSSGRNIEVPTSPLPAPTELHVSDKVEGRYHNTKNWFPGVVKAVSVGGDGSKLYDVEFDDGDSESGCYRRKLRCAGEKQSRLCSVGDKVDAKCSALDDQVVPGVVVTKLAAADTYEIEFKLSHIRAACSKLQDMEPQGEESPDAFRKSMTRNFIFAQYQIPPAVTK